MNAPTPLHADTVEVVPYDSHWPERFREEARHLRHALGDVATRIDHIGSASTRASRPSR